MSSPQTAGNHIAELLDFAASAGQPDVYSGKRGRQRYRLKMPLEVELVGTNEASFSVELHDLSAGGVGFWADRAVPNRAEVRIREWRPQGTADWIPGVVVHCTRGLSGFLIGARFCENGIADASATPSRNSASADTGAAANASKDQKTIVEAEEPPPAKTRTWTLRGKCMLIAAGCSGIGVLGAGSAVSNGIAVGGPVVAVPVVAALCGVLAAGLMWLVLSEETRYLQALRPGIDTLTQTGELPKALQQPPCPEMNGLDRVLVRLRDEIARHRTAAAAQREKLAALEQVESTILNMVAHDLRTPLTSILLYSELMRNELEKLDAAEQQHCLEIISVETNRLSRLIENMTNAQAMTTAEVETQRAQVCLPRLFQECVDDYQALAASKGIQLEVDCAANFPQFESDAGQVAQVLSNLVGNALKFTPQGGCVHLAAELHGNEVFFSVSDNGPGVPRAQWDSIFDRFTQMRGSFLGESPGVGIGLYVVQKIVDRLGGRVWVDSEPDKGAEFCVVLPKSPQPAIEHKESGRVLVCDYDAELTARMAQHLRMQGYTVEVAYSAGRLLEKIADNDYDVVLTDILLHDMPTKDVLTALCAAGRRYRLIVHTHVSQAAELRECGVDIVLTRPAERTDMIEGVRAAVKLRPNCATVLIVAPDEHALAAYGQRLASEGHLGLLVPTCHEASAQAAEYPFDRIMVAAELLDEDWSDLAELLRNVQSASTVVVVAPTVGKNERKRMQQLGVDVIPAQALDDTALATPAMAEVMA